jgi:hypothetical protein
MLDKFEAIVTTDVVNVNANSSRAINGGDVARRDHVRNVGNFNGEFIRSILTITKLGEGKGDRLIDELGVGEVNCEPSCR